MSAPPPPHTHPSLSLWSFNAADCVGLRHSHPDLTLSCTTAQLLPLLHLLLDQDREKEREGGERERAKANKWRERESWKPAPCFIDLQRCTEDLLSDIGHIFQFFKWMPEWLFGKCFWEIWYGKTVTVLLVWFQRCVVLASFKVFPSSVPPAL